RREDAGNHAPRALARPPRACDSSRMSLVSRRQAVLIGSGLVLSTTGLAQSYPDRPVRIVVPYAPGNTGDIAIRILTPHLQRELGQSIVVEPRSGAGGNLGAGAVAAAEPDGYTLLLGATNNFVINQYLYRDMGFDPVTAFEPI